MNKVFLIHGWSVKSTRTYQALHLKLAEAGYDLQEIYLGRYVSLDNDIEVRDVARALHNELERHLGPAPWSDPFHVITHSTGALVVKEWILEHYRGASAQNRPLENLVFLAGPHFGSRLAHHGRSMLAHAIYLGDTGRRILTALELGSRFSWRTNLAWLDGANWKGKGIRPFCLIGDRVKRNPLKSRIFPAGYEEGSDMVVRAAAGNLNFSRYELDGPMGTFRRIGAISDVPYGALWRYVHSGADAGIMNSIKRGADPAMEKYQNLRLILACLGVKTATDYRRVADELAAATAETRAKRRAYTQLDLRIRDETGAPIEDFRFTLGYFDNGEQRASDAVEDVHKNLVHPNHFTVFIRHDKLDPQTDYFFEVLGEADSPLYRFEPTPTVRRFPGAQLRSILAADQTTQMDVILRREAARELFVFHRGDDPRLHVEWNRRGEITETGQKIK